MARDWRTFKYADDVESLGKKHPERLRIAKAMIDEYESDIMLGVKPASIGLHPFSCCLVVYIDESTTPNEYEVVWNSRLRGPAPLQMKLAQTGTDAARLNFEIFAPNYTPKVGARVFKDLTPTRALARINAELDSWRVERPEKYAQLIEDASKRWDSRQAFVQHLADKYIREGVVGDVDVVTAGWLDWLAQARASGDMPTVVMTDTLEQAHRAYAEKYGRPPPNADMHVIRIEVPDFGGAAKKPRKS